MKRGIALTGKTHAAAGLAVACTCDSRCGTSRYRPLRFYSGKAYKAFKQTFKAQGTYSQSYFSYSNIFAVALSRTWRADPYISRYAESAGGKAVLSE